MLPLPFCIWRGADIFLGCPNDSEERHRKGGRYTTYPVINGGCFFLHLKHLITRVVHSGGVRYDAPCSTHRHIRLYGSNWRQRQDHSKKKKRFWRPRLSRPRLIFASPRRYLATRARYHRLFPRTTCNSRRSRAGEMLSELVWVGNWLAFYQGSYHTDKYPLIP